MQAPQARAETIGPLTDEPPPHKQCGRSSAIAVFGCRSVVKVARRVGIAFGSFVIAWLAVSLVAGWIFGSGNILVWVFAVVVGAGVYVDILRRDRRAG